MRIHCFIHSHQHQPILRIIRILFNILWLPTTKTWINRMSYVFISRMRFINRSFIHPGIHQPSFNRSFMYRAKSVSRIRHVDSHVHTYKSPWVHSQNVRYVTAHQLLDVCNTEVEDAYIYSHQFDEFSKRLGFMNLRTAQYEIGLIYIYIYIYIYKWVICELSWMAAFSSAHVDLHKIAVIANVFNWELWLIALLYQTRSTAFAMGSAHRRASILCICVYVCY